MDGRASAAVVERLRERIQKLQAAPRTYLLSLRTQVAGFDQLFPGGAVPLGTALELCGEAASGRTSLALRAVAAAGREGRLAAYVDGPRELYPPAAAALGVDLRRLLVVQPKAPGQLAWTAVQLCRSGAFTCVVLDLTHTGVRLCLAEGKKLADAAFRGGSLLILLTPPESPADGVVRLSTRAVGLSGLEVSVLRNRQGGAGARALIGWESLCPAPPVFRHRRPEAPPEGELGPLHPPYQRPKSGVDRDGGLCRSRPGRDCQLPSLAPSLGLSTH
ncbi:MAG: recombinase RecA [Myxococcales bacterium]|nr:recombinase RecA [Myxococcales bacterium]